MVEEMKYFLGMQIMQNNDVIFISHIKYLKYLCKRFGFKICNPIGTPMVIGCKLSRKDESSSAK